MSVTSRSFREIVESLLSPPDEIMLEVGASGELVVARLRVLLAALLLLLPLAHALSGGSLREVLVGLVAAMLINVFALVWLQLARRPRRYDWLSFATAGFDVTATTAVLVVLGATIVGISLFAFSVFEIVNRLERRILAQNDELEQRGRRFRRATPNAAGCLARCSGRPPGAGDTAWRTSDGRGLRPDSD